MAKSLQYRFSRLRRKRINEIRQRRKTYYEWEAEQKKNARLGFNPY